MVPMSEEIVSPRQNFKEKVSTRGGRRKGIFLRKLCPLPEALEPGMTMPIPHFDETNCQ